MDGEGIKLIRARLRKTQAEMSNELEVSRQSYIAWEKDTYKIPPAKLEKLLAMDQSIPDGGIAAKETAKEKRIREASEASLIESSIRAYRAIRAWPQYGPNHVKAMAYLAREGTTIHPGAYALLLELFPDILTDPNGDHAMTKEQSFATLGLSTPTKES